MAHRRDHPRPVDSNAGTGIARARPSSSGIELAIRARGEHMSEFSISSDGNLAITASGTSARGDFDYLVGPVQDSIYADIYRRLTRFCTIAPASIEMSVVCTARLVADTDPSPLRTNTGAARKLMVSGGRCATRPIASQRHRRVCVDPSHRVTPMTNISRYA